MTRPAALAALLILLAAPPLAAVTTQVWTLTTYEDFIAGGQLGTAVSVLGRLELAPVVRAVPGLEADFIWKAVPGPGRAGELFLTVGEAGRLLRVHDHSVETLLSADTGFYALAVDERGRAYAGSFPGGVITRWAEGKVTTFATLPEKYIWDLQFDGNGNLLAACGLAGNVYRIDPAGRATRILQAGEGHVLCLARGPDGSIYAGAAMDGLVYRVAPGGAVSVAADLSQQEVVALAFGPDGKLYAGVNPTGGPSGRATAAARARMEQMERRAGSDSAAAVGGEDAEPSPPELQPRADEDEAEARARARARARERERGRENGPGGDMLTELLANCAAVYRLSPDGNAALVYISDREIIHDFALLADGTLWVATGNEGKVFQVTPDEIETQLLDLDAGQVTALAPAPDGGWWLATGNGARLYRSGGVADSATFTAPVFDAKFPARWGRVRLLADPVDGVQFRTRAGQTSEPDTRWSGWSNWQPSGAAVGSPGGRYLELQVKLLPRGRSGSPLLREVTVAYQIANQRPLVLDLKVNGGDEGEGEPGTRRQAADAPEAETEREVMWQAADADGDRLTYNLYLQGEHETAWRWLNYAKPDQPAARFTWNTAELADGLYYLKVVASDQDANPEGEELAGEKIAGPYAVDNAPPRVEIGSAVTASASASVAARLTDAGGGVAGADYCVDNGEWKMLRAADGFFDSPAEEVIFTAGGLARGAHVITVRARDAGGRQAVAAVTVSVP